MEIRGMLGSRPVKLLIVGNEWLEVIDLLSGDEIVHKAIHRGVELDGDLLDIGGLSIAIDRTYISEVQALMRLVSRLPVAQNGPTARQSGFCVQCGYPVDSSARFCSTCGQSLGEHFQQVPPPPRHNFDSAPATSSREFDSHIRHFSEPSEVRSKLVMSSTGRRNLLIAVTVVVLLIVAVVATRGGNDSSKSSSGDVRSSAACATLSSYAYNGIPATFIDDGARLLYSLSDQFRSTGRGDIANHIDNIVDLTYAGPAGQLNAKSELISAASSYC
jgi:hypothetical protein